MRVLTKKKSTKLDAMVTLGEGLPRQNPTSTGSLSGPSSYFLQRALALAERGFSSSVLSKEAPYDDPL